MGKESPPPENGGNIEPVDLQKALEERYLAYALSTIMHRALPDVRDGLKPVHRRIIHAMRMLKLDPKANFVKCARIVGDVIGKFHPHGDQSVYDALVRLAQDFAQRYPLVDGQGNFGNIDGDNAAAYRYTEARMTDVAALLLEGIGEDAVDFRKTYNDEDEEPVVLPGAFPNLLANGSSGIAVGMATSIPPHNAAELCEAALELIKNRATPIERLVEIVPGPDFPTGGIIVEDKASILESYRTGKGGFRIRARWEVEDQGRGMWQVVVTEVPYQVQKSRLIEKIAELMEAKKLPLLDDVRDESAEDVRVVFVPKSRTVDAGLMMESLFKLTELESRFSLNMNVLTRGVVPNVLGLREVMLEWLDHRRAVLLRRSKHRLAEIDRRLEVLSGFLIAYLNIDEIIRIIRTEDNPKQVMIARFGLTDIQAEAILNIRLRALAKLEEFEIRKEFDALSIEKKSIEELLASDSKQWGTIAWEIGNVAKQFSKDTPLGKRRTTFADAPDHDEDAITQSMIEKEPVTVVLSNKGWLRALKGHIADVSSLPFKEGDGLQTFFHAQTTERMMFVTTGGKFYTLDIAKLPGGRGHGDAVRLLVDMENDQDILAAFVAVESRKRLVVSHEGNGFIISEGDALANTRKGKQVMNVASPDEMAFCITINPGDDQIAVVGENRKLLVFPLADVPEMGRGKGVRLQKYKDGGLLDVKTFKAADGLTWADSAGRNYVRTGAELTEWVGARASAGRMVPKGFPRTGKFAG
jgi:topoisomerase IV subunit A